MTRNMLRLVLASLVSVTLTSSAFADVTIKSTVSGKGMGMAGTMTSVTYLKAGKMRNETTVGDTTRVSIFDLDTQKTAAGYDMDVSIPATMGGEKGMKMTVSLSGPVWIVKGAPGTQEYMAFYKNAVEKGWFFSDPRQAKAQPGQAKAMAEMYRQIAATGGIPYEQDMNIKMAGEGQMGAMLARVGNVSMTTTVTSVETTAIPADLFAVPAGYTLKEQK